MLCSYEPNRTELREHSHPLRSVSLFSGCHFSFIVSNRQGYLKFYQPLPTNSFSYEGRLFNFGKCIVHAVEQICDQTNHVERSLSKRAGSLYTRLSQAAEAVAGAPSPCPESEQARANATEEEKLLSAAKLCSATSLRLDPSLPHPILSQKIAAGWLVQKYARNVKTLWWKLTTIDRITGDIRVSEQYIWQN